MISDINNPMSEDPLANEANLMAMLGMDSAQSESCDAIDPELALQTLLDDASLSQLLLRRQDEQNESLNGYFRLSVLPGQQRVSWHIPVSPPFSTMPTYSAEAVDGADARIRFTNIQKFGARAELVLPESSDVERTVLVMVCMTAASEK
jgi:hypothetical protein